MSGATKLVFYKLVNVERQNDLHPTTFLIPSKEEREALQPGAMVKLHFTFRNDQTERMWVCVKKRLGTGNYVGELRNSATNRGAKWGDKVIFGSENVATIHEGESN